MFVSASNIFWWINWCLQVWWKDKILGFCYFLNFIFICSGIYSNIFWWINAGQLLNLGSFRGFSKHKSLIKTDGPTWKILTNSCFKCKLGFWISIPLMGSQQYLKKWKLISTFHQTWKYLKNTNKYKIPLAADKNNSATDQPLQSWKYLKSQSQLYKVFSTTIVPGKWMPKN